MSFREEVNNTTKTVMIDTFITRMFSDPHRRFGDILEDLIEVDDPDDDWMRDTLYELEIGQFIKAGMKVLGFDADEAEHLDADLFPTIGDDADEEEAEDEGEYNLSGDSEEEEEVAPADPPKKKRKKKKKKPKNPADASPKKKKKKPQSIPSRARNEEVEDPEWKDYLKLIIKALRASKAYDDETAVNNGVILNHIHGEDSWDKDESADLRRGMEDLIGAGKTDKVGQRRGTRYYLR